MKTDITKHEFWYTYTKICDNCGATISLAGTWGTSEKPNNKKDFCLDCLYKFLDNNINPYKESYTSVLKKELISDLSNLESSLELMAYSTNINTDFYLSIALDDLKKTINSIKEN